MAPVCSANYPTFSLYSCSSARKGRTYPDKNHQPLAVNNLQLLSTAPNSGGARSNLARRPRIQARDCTLGCKALKLRDRQVQFISQAILP